MSKKELEERIQKMKHLLGKEEESDMDFHYPSLLKEVPSITTYDTAGYEIEGIGGKLGGHS